MYMGLIIQQFVRPHCHYLNMLLLKSSVRNLKLKSSLVALSIETKNTQNVKTLACNFQFWLWSFYFYFLNLFSFIFKIYFIFCFFTLLLWFNPSRELSITQPLTPYPQVEWRRRTGNLKLWEFMNWNQDSLLGKAKVVCTSKAKQEINSVRPTHG